MPKVNCPYCNAENDVDDYTVKGVEEPVRKKVALRKKCTTCHCILDRDLVTPENYKEYRRSLAGAGNPAAIREKYDKALDKGQAYAKRAYAVPEQDEIPGYEVLREKIERKLAKSDPLERESLRLGAYLVWKCARDGIKATWIQGPRKQVNRAFEKTASADYSFDYSQNKDWVRATLAVDNQDELKLAVERLQAITDPAYGFQRIKDTWADPNNEEKNPCAYTGYNGAVISVGASLPMEIQANTFRMMYGKEGKTNFMRGCEKNEGEYEDMSRLVGLPGGLGHAFYEIADRYGTPRSKESIEAGKIGTLYNRICRGAPAKRGEGVKTLPPQTMKERLEEFGGLLAESYTSGGKAAERPMKDGKPTDSMMDVWNHAGGLVPPKYQILVAKSNLKKDPVYGWDVNR